MLKVKIFEQKYADFMEAMDRELARCP